MCERNAIPLKVLEGEHGEDHEDGEDPAWQRRARAAIEDLLIGR